MDDAPDRSSSPPSVDDVLVRAHKLDTVARLVPGVIHELNNPLAAIVGFGELLRRDPRLPDDLRADAELLVRETGRARQTIQTVLEFLRARPPERMPTSVRALVEAVLLLHGYALVSSGIDVQVDIPADLPQVELDRPGLQLVLLDLVQEAIDAIVDGGGTGGIRVSASAEGSALEERVEVSVTWTARPPSSGSPGGSADREIARRIAAAMLEAHAGELRSTRSADGGTVTVVLPVRAGPPSAADPPAAVPAGRADDGTTGEPVSGSGPGLDEPSASRATRVLVLDDERPIRMLLEKWLRASGFEPVVASTGEEAVEYVRDGTFDAVLCDHRMAGMSGTDVFDAVVALRPELAARFVFMSGDVLNPQLRQFVEDHGVRLLPKPFDFQTVQRTLDGVLSGDTAEP